MVLSSVQSSAGKSQKQISTSNLSLTESVWLRFKLIFGGGGLTTTTHPPHAPGRTPLRTSMCYPGRQISRPLAQQRPRESVIRATPGESAEEEVVCGRSALVCGGPKRVIARAIRVRFASDSRAIRMPSQRFAFFLFAEALDNGAIQTRPVTPL